MKWSPRSILPISRSKFRRKIKNWIFSKSTENGLLKNVQYGITFPLGSREIPKTKVDTVLWDTLYNAIIFIFRSKSVFTHARCQRCKMKFIMLNRYSYKICDLWHCSQLGKFFIGASIRYRCTLVVTFTLKIQIYLLKYYKSGNDKHKIFLS